MKNPPLLLLVIIVVGILPPLVGLAPAQSYQPTLNKQLFARAPQANSRFGQSVALSSKYLLVGEYYNSELASRAGAAHLFDAKTGRLLRTVTPGIDVSINGHFGEVVAVNDQYALVGSSQGAAYLFNAKTGVLIRKLTSPESDPDDGFGGSVAMNGSYALIGAPSGDSGDPIVQNTGAAYLFDLKTGAFMVKYEADDGADGDNFGSSVALDGTSALIGAYGKGSLSGAAYLFNIETGVRTLFPNLGSAGAQFGGGVAIDNGRILIAARFEDDPINGVDSGAVYVYGDVWGGKLTAPSGMPADSFGRSVSISGNLAVIGASQEDSGGLDSGAAYLYDVGTGAFLAKIKASDVLADARYGLDAAICDGRLAVGAPRSDHFGDESGSVYYYHELAAPLPFAAIAVKGGLASDTLGSRFKSFTSVYTSSDVQSKSVLNATLSGADINAGRTKGVWDQLDGASLKLSLRVKETDLGTGVKAAKILRAWSNRADVTLMEAVLAGSNKQAVLRRATGASTQVIASTGETLGGVVVGKFLQTVQSRSDLLAISAQLKTAGLVNKTNDSAIIALNHAGVVSTPVIREGVSSLPAGGALGQLSGRVAIGRNNERVGFAGSRLLAGLGMQALFNAEAGGSIELAAFQGASPAAIQPAVFRAFLAESMSSQGRLVWRASLSGTHVTAKNNEVLWHEEGAKLVARKGLPLDNIGLYGVGISRFMQFWPAGQNSRALFLAKLTGAGVKSSNDLALFAWTRDAVPELQVVLREGQLLGGGDSPTVKTIQRVEVDPSSRFAALCSLTGASARNQALITGLGISLRKGTLYANGSAVPRRLKGITFSPTTDKTGSGGKGIGRVIEGSGTISLTVIYDNKAVEVVQAKLSQ